MSASRSSQTSFEIKTGYRPGIFGALISMNADYYIRQLGFDHKLEAVIAQELALFWHRFDATRDAIIYAEDNGPVVGGLLLEGINRDSSSDESAAKIKWFIVGNAARNLGLGQKLLNKAIIFAKQSLNYRSLTLSTHDNADAAKHIYEKAGFELIGFTDAELLDIIIRHRHYTLDLG